MNQIGKIIKENNLGWVAQPINFTLDIMSQYYVGDCFLDLNITEELKTGALTDRIERAGTEGFMPKMVDELKLIIGEGNYRFDGYAFGSDEINFYFLIRKAEYNQIMNKIKYWAIAKDLDDMILMDENTK